MRQDAGKRRGDDLVGFGRHGDRGRDADEEQQRRHQKAAADAEHAGQDTDKPAQSQEEERVDRNLGNGQVDLHGALNRRSVETCALQNVAGHG